jgi:L-ascorbate metabolism protein UlaG (beta-lactamase superfamily)
MKRVFKLFVLIAMPLLVLGAISAWRGLGHGASGSRLARMRASPQWKNGAFENPQPLDNHFFEMLSGMFHASAYTSPEGPLHFDSLDRALLSTPPQSGLRVTWLGHSTTLIEIDGSFVVTDPVWSENVSPVTWVGPTRYYPKQIDMLDLPKIDAVLVSHDHYDHLDERTVVALGQRGTTFIVPLGVGAHLEYWGIPAAQIIEKDWWESTRVGALEIVCTPARHASGRAAWDKDATLWASYSLIGPKHRVFFSGDTGLFTAMRDIGEKYGPFDLTLIEVGQYHRAWPDWHIGPEQAVKAHTLLKGKVFMPMHWGLFTLAYHGWTEPVERAWAEAAAKQVRIVTPKPGEPFDPTTPTEPSSRWWPTLPWETAEQHTITSTQVEL